MGYFVKLHKVQYITGPEHAVFIPFDINKKNTPKLIFLFFVNKESSFFYFYANNKIINSWIIYLLNRRI